MVQRAISIAQKHSYNTRFNVKCPEFLIRFLKKRRNQRIVILQISPNRWRQLTISGRLS
jgi:hypothetical protein